MVREAPPPADLDDGNPLAILGLELGHAVDRHLAQLETELIPRGEHDAAGCLTEMAARRGVENDFGYG